MAHSGFEVSQEAMDAFQKIKGHKGPKIRVLACDQKKGEVVLHKKDPSECPEVNLDVIKKLLSDIGAQAVYLIIDFPVAQSTKLLCVKWVPDDCTAAQKMICSATFDEVKTKLTGCYKYLQFTEFEDFDDLDLSKY